MYLEPGGGKEHPLDGSPGHSGRSIRGRLAQDQGNLQKKVQIDIVFAIYFDIEYTAVAGLDKATENVVQGKNASLHCLDDAFPAFYQLLLRVDLGLDVQHKVLANAGSEQYRHK